MPSDTIVSLPSETIKKFEATTIQNHRIQQEVDNIKWYFQSPTTITPTINGIVDYLNIISDAGNRLKRILTNLQTQIADSQIQLATLQNDYDLLYQAYRAHKLNYHLLKATSQQNSQQLQDCKTNGAITTHLLNLTTNRYNKWKNKCKTLENDLLLADVQLDNKNSEQLINNLNQQILALQYNPPNMMTVAGDLTSIAPLIAQIPNYSRQIPSDKWYQRINQILTLPSIMASTFNNALRAVILKSKMAGKYTNIPTQYPVGTNIDTSARYIVWLHHKYQTKTVGTQQVATQRLAQEKFLPFDNPESYEARICPLLLGVAVSSQLQKTQALQSQQKQPDFSDYLRVPDIYMPERLPDEYGVNSEKFIHLQSKKNIEVDSDEELADRMGKLSINKALLKGFEAEVHAVIKLSKHCCSNCNRTGHNSRKKKVNQKSNSNKSFLKRSPNHVKQKKTHLLQLEKLKSETKNLTTPDFTNYREPASEIPESEEKETLDDPIEIDFVKKKEPITSIATILVKIKCLKILAMYNLSGVATVPTESIGVTCNFSITLPPGFTIDEDFAVIHYNGEDFIIPVTMHKVKNKLEVNCATTSQDDKPLISDQISQKVDSNEDDNIPLEEWCAFTDSSLDSVNLTLAKQAPNLLVGIESDMGVVDSGYKVSLLIWLKFSDEVDGTNVEMILCIIYCWHSRSSYISSTQLKQANIANVYTFQNIKDHRLGSIREEELEKKIHDAIKSKAEINKLSKKLQNKYIKQIKAFDRERKGWNQDSLRNNTEIQKLRTYTLQVINEHKQLQNENTNLISHNAQKDIFIAESKAENVTKSKKIKSLEFMIMILESKLSSVQKDVISIQSDSSKKESEILSLKSKIVEVEHELASKVSELECLKSEAISNLILGGNDEKNMTKSDDISAVIEESEIRDYASPSKNLRQYFECRKSMDQAKKIDDNISAQTSTFGTCFVNDEITELPKIDTEVNFEVKDRTSISEINKDDILDYI
ncbi:1453_t:CDS:10 [Cetraspora pellucida]|uniref:1453_t:CDS:1 n=1 Tax=Cetraspora pellucida TaxID=1433469 RepID=A0A9N9BGG1_9GLOM|nr:1453_t:CDS:10 [Cetraspora pellucida]